VLVHPVVNEEVDWRALAQQLQRRLEAMKAAVAHDTADKADALQRTTGMPCPPVSLALS
jgi:hypothetical protein